MQITGHSITIIEFIVVIMIGLFIATKASPMVFGEMVLIPDRVRIGDIWRMFTYQFVHGDLYHLIINLYTFFSIGMFVESHFGSIRTIIFILFCALAVSAVDLTATWNKEKTYGMSGIIGGLFGIFIIYMVSHDILRSPSVRFTLINGVISFVMVSLMRDNSKVGLWTGVACGLLAGLMGVCGVISW